MLQENLIMLRSIAGKTQEDIAEVIGISRQAYAKWERGETIPDIEKCGRLAEFYGVTMDSLIKDDVQLEGKRLAPAPKGKHMWGVVTVNDRGQIVIPKEARETFGLGNGRKCGKDTFSAVKTEHLALPTKCREYSQMRKQLKDLLKSHRLRRATERKWKHAYARIAG